MPLVALTNPSASNEIDRYELLFRFAAGGMAEVFVARQRGEGGFLRPVAIKRMLPALAEEPKFVDMFLDEARLAAHVQSPHVVSTLDCGKDAEGSPYIVMELVVGVSLSQALRAAAEKKRHVDPAVVAEIVAQTAIGLDDAHEARTPAGQPLEIVHRDVSPQNILVGIDGRARLTDFGVARALERVTRTSTGEVKGKLSYFSPEQAKMEPIDRRSDIFALGIVAWEALALERLFSRESPMQAIAAIVHERIPDVREANPDVPERLALVIARALERDLDRRYATARQLAEDLRAAVVTPAPALAVARWVEESGGPRLAAFRKRIETSFVDAQGERSSIGETERASAPSSAGIVSVSVPPESRVVGSLGTIPDRPIEREATATEVRQAAASAPPPPMEPSSAGEAVVVDFDAAPHVSSAPRWPWLLAASATGLVIAGVGVYVVASAAPTAAPETPPAAHAPPPTPALPTAIEPALTPVGRLPPPVSNPLPDSTPAHRRHDSRPGPGPTSDRVEPAHPADPATPAIVEAPAEAPESDARAEPAPTETPPRDPAPTRGPEARRAPRPAPEASGSEPVTTPPVAAPEGTPAAGRLPVGIGSERLH